LALNGSSDTGEQAARFRQLLRLLLDHVLARSVSRLDELVVDEVASD
jgi:hypothetical protein